jgi:hypothetical protein
MTLGSEFLFMPSATLCAFAGNACFNSDISRKGAKTYLRRKEDQIKALPLSIFAPRSLLPSPPL